MNFEALDRLQLIRARLEADGRVKVADLAVELEVSEMTIRRDLDLIVDEGVAQRIRGGAMAVGPQQYALRHRQHARAKSKIADKLTDLVPSQGAIGLDASSTVQRLAQRLAGVRDLTVITNGPATFDSLQGRSGVTALLTGGGLDPRTGSLVGPLAVRAARELFLARLFMSAAALDAELGSSESTLEDAAVKLALADSASEVILAVDSSKLDGRAPARAFEIDRIDYLVTELEPDDKRLDPYRERVGQIV